MTLLYLGHGETIDLEWAWHHALCCMFPTTDGQFGWWACEIIERRGAEAVLA